jgi:hypothetical protein
MPNYTESLSPISQVPVPDVQDGLSLVEGNHKIFDTGDLCQVNFVYNNITFQVHPGPKITNDSNNGTDVMPGEDESGTTTFHKSNTNKESQQYIFQ